ncbi:MAG: hypothetical protein J6125_00660, partial [Clostridia bacterium]|nr:hypothetical protein [Clostridia bacterium]
MKKPTWDRFCAAFREAGWRTGLLWALLAALAGGLHFLILIGRDAGPFWAEVCVDISEIARPLLWLPWLCSLILAGGCAPAPRRAAGVWGWLCLTAFGNSLVVNLLEYIDLYLLRYRFGFVFWWALLDSTLPEVLSVAATAWMIRWACLLVLRRAPETQKTAAVATVCGVGMGLYLFLSEEIGAIIDYFGDAFGVYYPSEI